MPSLRRRQSKSAARRQTRGAFAGGPLTDDPVALGLIAIDLASSFSQWIRRRKTTYEFVDEATLNLRMSIDLVLPDADWFAEPPSDGQTIYVPLDIFKKQTLAGFSATDREGRSVSVLNTEENGTLATEGMSALVDGFAGAVQPGRFRPAIADIVLAATYDAGEAAFRTAMAQGLDQALPRGGQHEALLKDLRGGFLMLVPVDYHPDANHLFKLAWSSPYTWTASGVGGRLRGTAASLGLVDKDLEFVDLPIGFAHGTHFEFRAPENVRNLQTILSVDQYDADHPESGSRVQIERRLVVYAKPQANVNVSVRTLADVDACRSDLASVRLKLRSRRGGPFMAIVIVSWITTGLLWALAERVAQLDVQTTSAIVLVLPAILVAWLAREGEHAIASRLLGGVRVLGLTTAGVAFAAAIVIAVGDVRAPARPAVQHVRCSATTATVGPPRQLRTELRGLVCNVPAQTRLQARADPDTADALRILAVVATFFALILATGLWSTHHATRTTAARDDESHPEP